MKISLVVASGVHQGKVINVPGAKFLIGRDEGCHLRPASPAISKQHCVLFVREGKAYVQDLGSTNGTFINDEPVQGERELTAGDRLRAGPLDFLINLTPGSVPAQAPLSGTPAKGTAPKSDPARKPAAAEQPTAAAAALPTPAASQKPSSKSADEDPDKIAAMLLSMGDDDSSPEVPGGSTIMELPSVDAGAPGAAAGKPEEKKKAPSQAETSAAASEILRKYMRRPK